MGGWLVSVMVGKVAEVEVVVAAPGGGGVGGGGGAGVRAGVVPPQPVGQPEQRLIRPETRAKNL